VGGSPARSTCLRTSTRHQRHQHHGAAPKHPQPRRDRAATLEAGSVVGYRLEAGEVDWEIAPGRKVRGYGFNGQAPGPVLEAKQGVPLEIEFMNRLPEPTVIH
jgi:FtsP/CotA-like multicopper oxidase with cupredoxin domain